MLNSFAKSNILEYFLTSAEASAQEEPLIRLKKKICSLAVNSAIRTLCCGQNPIDFLAEFVFVLTS